MRMLVLVMLASVYSFAGAQTLEKRFVVDDIAAVVGDEIILSSEIKWMVLQTAQETGLSTSDTTGLRKLSDEVLDVEIGKKILLHHAKQAKIEVTDEEVARMVENNINELRRRYPSEDAFLRDVAAAGQTLSGLRDSYREQAREELMRQGYLREHSHEFPRVKVTEEEAREFFETQSIGNSPEQIKYQYLVISPRPGKDVLDQAETRIDSILKMYNNGADFGYLAEKYSDGPTAPKGGDLGFFSKGDMVKEFEDAAFDMKVGEVRKVKTKYGWHLIRVESRRQKEVRARNILAATEIKDADWERAYQLTDSLRQRVLTGDKFFKLAKEFSEETDNLSESPAFTILESLPQNVRQALRGKLTPVPGKPSRISEIVELKPTGYLLVLELERKEAAPFKFGDVSAQIMERLAQKKSIEAFVDKLRKKTYIDIRFKGWSPLAGGLE
ncbi:MAG TPA: peptidylprolyl isomerase [archaeon]|nr:peptidylprolyl isomerase [archaeon]